MQFLWKKKKQVLAHLWLECKKAVQCINDLHSFFASAKKVLKQLLRHEILHFSTICAVGDNRLEKFFGVTAKSIGNHFPIPKEYALLVFKSM